MTATTPRYRAALEHERARVLELQEALTVSERDTGEAAAVPEMGGLTQHPADLGTDAFERTKDLSILASLDDQLREVDRALERLERGTYGVCEACGDPIVLARLEALPATRFCVTDQAAAERALSA